MSEDRSKYFDIKVPEVPPQINMKSPEFNRLTSAEKLNDSEYRGVIYRTFPNEPICACSINLQLDGRNSIGKCPGNCMNNCCNRTHSTVTRVKNNANKSCENFESTGNHNGVHCPLKNGVRLRGGGCENVYRQWEDLDNSRIPRTGVSNYYYTTRADNHQSDAYGNPPNSSQNPRKCQTNPTGCGEGPCIGADCFQRTLQETQEFVDSLGRVPGLAGLGLQDPSESPYFRTRKFSSDEMEKAPPLKDSKNKKRNSRAHNHQKYQKLNDPVLIKTKPFTLPSSGKRDTLQGSLVSPLERFSFNLKNSEEVADGTGPCGESCCRSRRKIKQITSSHEILKSKDKERRSSSRSFKHRRLSGRKNRKIVPVHGGEELRSRRTIKYVYLAGDTYPGGAFGHKNCNDPRKRVPANMGWLWNDYQALGRLKPRVGWRPGAISRTMREIIRETKAGALEDIRSRSAHSRSKLKNRSQTSMKKGQSKRLDDEEEEEPPPTLHILRKDGTYYVTMYPIKQEKMEVPQLEEPMKPLQFKIVKDKDESESESSTASDIEIEFSPPAAVNRYRKKPDVVHADVQVKQQEILDAFKPVGEKKKDKKGKKGKK